MPTMEERVRLYWNRVEQTVGSMKFAVVVITLFAVSMMAGTLLESYFGTDFAGRVIYKNWLFMLLQGAMFLSILFAAFLRLPPRKKLYGFYTIHTGLILIGAGSLITYLAGIDGSIFLAPGTPTRKVQMPQDTVIITRPSKGMQIHYTLPFTAFKRQINAKYSELDMEILTYLPYASRRFALEEPKKEYGGDKGIQEIHSGHYKLSNGNVTQDFWLSLHPEAKEFDSSLQLGPLSIHYLPSTLAPCFAGSSNSGLILWNNQKGECFIPEKRGLIAEKNKKGQEVLLLKEGGKSYQFFPRFSPWPLDSSMKPIQDSPFRIFSKKLFTTKPHLFLLGTTAAFYDKEEKIWITKHLNKNKTAELPWMGFELSLLAHETKRVPAMVPRFTWPIQSNNQLIAGEERAVLIKAGGKKFWVSTDSPQELMIKDEPIVVQISQQSLLLPFEFILDRFEMEKNPGTQTPASFESFVRVFSNEGAKKHHIYMNNPLKRDGFTFYQASYSHDGKGNYSSTLSVNVDPGRPIKYGGSLLLVLGTIWHYYIRREHKKSAALKLRTQETAGAGLTEVYS